MLQSLLAETIRCAPDARLLILNSAADPSIPRLARQLKSGKLVLAEDNIAAGQQAEESITRASTPGLRLRQVAFHEYILHEAAATMDIAVMNILYQPRNAWMYYALQLASYALKPGGQLYIEGAKNRGILSLGKHAQELFGNLETLQISKGERVIRAIKRETALGKIVAPTLAPFAEGKIDEGTGLLLEHMEVHVTDVALDLGCGAGFIGAHIAAHATKGQVTLVDVSRASVAAAQKFLAERGLNNALAQTSDGIQAVQGQRFDLVATNPPFHVGGIQTTAVAERFIREAATILRPRGRFYLVANRFLKYETLLNSCFSQVTEVGGNARFKVLLATGTSREPPESGEKETILFKLE